MDVQARIQRITKKLAITVDNGERTEGSNGPSTVEEAVSERTNSHNNLTQSGVVTWVESIMDSTVSRSSSSLL